MENHHFDALVQHLSEIGTRRGLLRLLAAGPCIGGLTAFLVADDMTARHRKPAGDDGGLTSQKHKHKKHKKKCARAGQATSKKRKKCCKGLAKDATGHCVKANCDVCGSGCPFKTVQAAVDAASTGDTITICPGAYVSSTPVPVGGLVTIIEKALTLVGAGDGDDPSRDTILDGNGNSKVVAVYSSAAAKVSLQGLRITGGSDPLIGGGGLHNDGGTVTMTDCSVVDSRGWFGGGIYTSDGSLTMTSCTITGNTGEYGGGLHVDSGLATITACDVTGNAAAFGGAGHLEGGGIFVTGGTVNLNNSTVSNNEADYGAGIWIASGTVTLDSSDVAGNTAARFGGGIVNTGTINLLNGSSVNGNVAGDPPPSGGGIMNQGTVDASGGSITGNTPDDCINGFGGAGCPGAP